LATPYRWTLLCCSGCGATIGGGSTGLSDGRLSKLGFVLRHLATGKALLQGRGIQVAADEHQLRAAGTVSPRAQILGVHGHVDPLNDDATRRILKVQEALHAIEPRALSLQNLRPPRMEPVGNHGPLRDHAERSHLLVMRMARIERPLYRRHAPA